MNAAGATTEHFIGIGGIGMSALALHRRSGGAVVTGSDVAESEQTRALAAAGIPVAIGHRAENLPANADRVVITAAIPAENPELREARRRGTPTVTYAEWLGETVRGFDSVGVAGCHGKTTTTAMLAWILESSGARPRAVVGGVVPHFGGNALLGDGSAFVVEACEYRRSFLQIGPRHAIITNIGADHLDYFKDMDDIRDAFRDYVRRLPPEGTLVLPLRTASDLGLDASVAAKVIRLGDAERGATVVGDALGFHVVFPDGERTPVMRLFVPGEHNVQNAALAATLAHAVFRTRPAAIASALESFRGVGRRFEVLAESADVAVVDDYAHHPDEISATIAAARGRFPSRRVVALFQPHLESRTNALFEPFITALSRADLVLAVADYRVAGRDKKSSDGAERLAKELRRRGRDAVFAGDLQNAVECGLFHRRAGDVLLVMGAGDVREVSLELARRVS